MWAASCLRLRQVDRSDVCPFPCLPTLPFVADAPFIVVANIVVDLVYAFLDPRVRAR